MNKGICTGLVWVLLASCGQPEASFDLCDCQTWDQGRRDMHLSEKCIEATLEKFGPSLEGMEAWFRENCDPMEPKPNTDEEFAHSGRATGGPG